jgi:PAS domain S-box-containing protein
LDFYSQEKKFGALEKLPAWLADARLDAVIVADRFGNIIGSNGDCAGLVEKNILSPFLWKALVSREAVSGFWVDLGNRLWLLSCLGFDSEDGGGGLLGDIVVGRLVNDVFLRKISSAFDVRADVLPSGVLKDGSPEEAVYQELVYSGAPFLIQHSSLDEKGARVGSIVFLLRDLQQEAVGMLRLRTRDGEAPGGLSHFPAYLMVLLPVLVFSFLFIAHFLTRHISGPLEKLRKIIGDIVVSKDFSKRLKEDVQDEIGALIEEFNKMLDEIQKANEKIKRSADEVVVLYKDLLGQKKFTSDILSLASSIVLVLMPDGRVKFVNAAIEKVSGYKPEETIGSNWFDVFFPIATRQEAKEAFEGIVRGGAEFFGQQESCIITREGAQRTILWSNNLIKDESGVVNGVLFVGQDITEHRKVETELKKKVNELERFYRVTMDREKAILQLKKEIKELKAGHEI